VHKLQEQIELVYLTAQRRHANIQQISSKRWSIYSHSDVYYYPML
jgi:hypothetical protein